MSEKIDVYTLEELKTLNPDAFEKVLQRWADGVANSGDIPWSREIMDSLRAVVEACGATLKNWSIGPYSQSSITVSVYDEYDDARNVTHPKDAGWLRREVLKPHGYVKRNGHADFPGHCKFTGYCADDDFLEAVYKSLQRGNTLTESLEGLADKARELMEGDLEQAQNEESMMVNWGESLFTIDGVMI